ncbi:MAG TPA: HoxN/HupN/NixA family nickel/cobalt transporter [Capsulimonadaceae bacterium]|nr:HoxN/HupN/NixA family nickel/cobalt transporter [Capsulimonadaceae bacterium]
MVARLSPASGDIKLKIILLTALLVAANVAFWLLTWLSSRQYMILWNAALVAYGFGLRHAVDADHISAIDNTTRRLMQLGKRPIGVGFFFSLGHSSVVLLLCLSFAVSAAYVQHHLPQWKSIGGVAGPILSSLFLYLIGLVNLVVLIDLYRGYRDADNGKSADSEKQPQLRGVLGKLLVPLLSLVRASWQMYFIGLLFGLGFDTATEVGTLALSARLGESGIPLWAIMLLPLLFTVGMCLVDTLDGILMLGAYGWAFVKPARKLFYNLSITTISVLVAFVVGTAELAQILASGSASRNTIVQVVGRINLDQAGFAIVGLFLVLWLASVAFSRARRAASA